MRFLFVLWAAVAMTSAAFASPPPGVYDFQDQANAEACAQVCADDTLCVAWTFGGAGKCALMAAAPEQAPEAGWASGFSPNAPAFLRSSAQSGAPEPTEIAPAKPVATQHVALRAETTAETALLGGPDDGAIRARLQ